MRFDENIKKGAESGIQALKEGTNVVFSEVGKLLKISEKRIDIGSYKKKLEKNYTTLGKLVHKYLTDGVTNPLDQADVRELLQNIYRYNEKIQTLYGEIEIIKSMKTVQSKSNNNYPSNKSSKSVSGTPENAEKSEKQSKPTTKNEENSPNG